ncbi:hypothetical protein [Oenococcus oeni]|uniref:hypothetical protein n=1 Tax=Oenococcus oeni TaxID=1247 RepID=UPI0008F8B491|nr:hypothetical protein [Oenococcus oeni]OIK56122.1 hypothetical protein ATW60_11870 [Oenococcus oeni]
MNELNKLKSAEGDNSEAIRKQTIRVNETATKIAHATSEMKDLREQSDKRSGIAKLNDEIKQSESVTNSFVERLKAEGDTAGATKAKISGLTDQSGKLKDLYSKQVDELNELKSA